jgi:NodT family efflux transporter outer membrane factor (OMF) lipoprotein
VKRTLVLLFGGLTGCGGVLHGVDEAPEAPVDAAPAWSSPGAGVEPFAGRWWETFDDPRLDALVTEALGRNLDLVAAYARIAQAEALRKSARSGLFPQIDGSASGSRARRNFNFGSGTIPVEQDTFSLSASASYEVDVWGRVAHAAKAATREFRASAYDAQTAAITVAARVATTYYELVEQRAILGLLEAQVEASETYLELLELRFDQGTASGLDVFQQRQQVASQKSNIPPVQARIDVLENALSVLLARPPQNVIVERASLPRPPPYPAVGIPSEVLRQRPDVRAAELRLVAQDHRLGSAIADRYPRVNLTGSVGFNAFDFTDLFEQFVWSLGASVMGPIFDGGRLVAEVDRNRAVVEERLATYGQTILGALEEVENAMVNERRQVEFIEALDRQLEAARATLEQAQLQYANGLTDYLPVLTALTQTQQLERAVVAARRQRLAFRIQLHRALGGTWAEKLERPSLSRAEADGPGESS